MKNNIFKSNMSLTTNLVSLLCVIIGAIASNHIIFNAGLFALSGALTNWLAIHMLFEKVPGLYGSGVIPARFEDFKKGIRNLVMGQFFTKDNMEHFFEESGPVNINLVPVVEKINFDSSFDSLLSVIMESSFGPMLGIIGGVEALKPIKEPFILKMKETFLDIAETDSVQKGIIGIIKNTAENDQMISKIENIVQKRLDELTPDMVKEIIHEMIRKHLGWLVVWGGVFGGLIGLATAFINLQIA